jgi:predicted transcriptional regulator
MTNLKEATLTQMEDYSYSDEYAQYIMTYGDPSERSICNGDSLTLAMEDGYLFDEFLASVGLISQ